MTIDEIKAALKTKEYDFLRNNEHLGKNIILLGLGGSHAYGMEHKDSDLDVRGIALSSKSEILLGNDFDQVVDTPTDTTIYSFNKIITLVSSNNPNTVELLGLKPEHYLYLSDIGRELLDNKKMFLSKICIKSFAGYSQSQLRRMENKANRLVGQVILGNCNPKRHITYEKWIMDQVSSSLENNFIMGILELVVFFSNDEIVFDVTLLKENNSMDFAGSILDAIRYFIKNTFSVPFRVELFTIHKIDGTDGYYKEIYTYSARDGFAKEKKYEFKCLDNYILPFVLRKFQCEEITENDKIFYHEGLLSKFIEVPEIEVNLDE